MGNYEKRLKKIQQKAERFSYKKEEQLFQSIKLQNEILFKKIKFTNDELFVKIEKDINTSFDQILDQSNRSFDSIQETVLPAKAPSTNIVITTPNTKLATATLSFILGFTSIYLLFSSLFSIFFILFVIGYTKTYIFPDTKVK